MTLVMAEGEIKMRKGIHPATKEATFICACGNTFTATSTSKNDENMKFSDIFKVVVKNDQLRASIIAILLYYTGSGVLVAGGLNYFYFSFGYGEGGSYQFIFTVVFAIATFAAQFLFPLFKNKFKWSKMKIFTIA